MSDGVFDSDVPFPPPRRIDEDTPNRGVLVDTIEGWVAAYRASDGNWYKGPLQLVYPQPDWWILAPPPPPGDDVKFFRRRRERTKEIR